MDPFSIHRIIHWLPIHLQTYMDGIKTQYRSRDLYLLYLWLTVTEVFPSAPCQTFNRTLIDGPSRRVSVLPSLATSILLLITDTDWLNWDSSLGPDFLRAIMISARSVCSIWYSGSAIRYFDEAGFPLFDAHIFKLSMFPYKCFSDFFCLSCQVYFPKELISLHHLFCWCGASAHNILGLDCPHSPRHLSHSQ